MTTQITFPDSLDHAVNRAHEWIREVARELGTVDEALALRVLRGVLHVLRDRLPIEHAVHLGSQLPTLIRGYYYEGFGPRAETRKERREWVFIDQIQQRLQAEDRVSSGVAARVVFGLLARHVTPGAVTKVKEVLPQALRQYWP